MKTSTEYVLNTLLVFIHKKYIKLFTTTDRHNMLNEFYLEMCWKRKTIVKAIKKNTL